MEAKWLSVQSFLNNQQLISAINTFCISLVLRLEGEETEEKDSNALRESKVMIRKFISDLDGDIQNYIRSRYQVLPGIDPRRYELVKRFVVAKTKHVFLSKAFQETPGKITNLLDSEDSEDMEILLASLSELRILLEEHNQADVQNLVPDI